MYLVVARRYWGYDMVELQSELRNAQTEDAMSFPNPLPSQWKEASP
jgi:hypothetical protein